MVKSSYLAEKEMMWLSNIIRINHPSFAETKVIQTKKIEKRLANDTEQVLDPALKKQQLLHEIEALGKQFQNLQEQLREQQENAKATIDNWWQEKQQEAQQYAEKLAEEASNNGFDAGYQQGMLEAKEHFQEKRNLMEDLIQTAYQEKDKIIQSSEAFLLSLSVKVAEKVIKQEIAQDHEKKVNIVRMALKKIEESEDVTIQVAPEDYPIILPFIEELQTYVRADSELKVIPASNLSPGGCMIHTASGSYDVTVDGQLDEIKKQLLAYCEEKSTQDDKDK